MSSKIIGLGRKLTWDDYKVIDQTPQQNPHDADTKTSFMFSGLVPDEVDASGGRLSWLRDRMVMRVILGSDSWRLRGVSNWPTAQQDALLRHEQGHYDIQALLCRDFLEDARAMTMTDYPWSQSAAEDRLNDIREATVDRNQELSDLYDADTSNSQDEAPQRAWLEAIRRAATVNRTPQEKDPDGQYLKLRLTDALRAGGFIPY